MSAATGGRLDRWIARHPARVRGVSTTLLVARVAQRFLDVRVMGLAAEMTYYALLSVFPLIGALGASLGFLERFVGTAAMHEAEITLIRAMQTVFSPGATADVITPLVHGLLHEERAGFAVGGFLLSLFFTSRVFRSAIDTLDVAYRVEERRSAPALWGLGLVYSLAAVIVIATLVTMIVVGPLLGGGRAIAEWLGLATAWEIAWSLARWPVVFAVATGFLTLLYRFGPNVRNRWRDCVPGALFGMAALILVAFAFRLYIELTGLQSPQITDADDAVAVALQLVGLLMAALFWLWLSGMVVLTGGVLNAELGRLRRRGPPPRA
jgi:membrane protein